MMEKKSYLHVRKLTLANQFVVVFLKFAVNFNESLLSASFVQTFFKFYGINLWSSTIIWAFPPILFILLSPLYRHYFMTKKYNTFLLNMVAQSLMFFFSAVGFITLFNLENFAAQQVQPSAALMLLGGMSFTVIDFSKYIYENLLFDYMADYVSVLSDSQFAYVGVVVEKVGRMAGALVSCLYVVRRKTDFAQFSASFYTNMQFAYYFAMCVNSLAVCCIFLFWPKEFNLQLRAVALPAASLLDYFLPGYSLLLGLERRNKFLLVRLFFFYGLYWFIATNLTQWISNKFMHDYPDIVSNSPMQAVDVGTSWGSLSLAIFYTLWGMMHVVVYPLTRRLLRFSKRISQVLNLAGFAIYTTVFFVYPNRNIKYFVMLQGFGGLCYDWVLYEKIKINLRKDRSLDRLAPAQVEYATVKVMETVEFAAEVMFFMIVPVVFVNVSDRALILAMGLIMAVVAVRVPPRNPRHR